MENSKVIFEELEETEIELSPNKDNFYQAVVWGTDWTTETIARQLEKGNIDLNPSFQRRDAWTNKEKSKLIESLMLGLPVPPIILAESKEKKNSYIVIDGKQRLLSIRRFYSKITEKEFKEKAIKEKDVFKQLKLSGLEILKELNGCSYEEIEKENGEYINNLENQAIRTIVIKNWPDESFLYTVFLRLNTGSKKLSPQELRQALKPGAFLDFLDDATATSDIIKKMLNNKDADPRMKDIELALRYFSFKYNITNYTGNLKEFLDQTCQMLNDKWMLIEEEIREDFVQLEKAIEFVYDTFDSTSPFSRYGNGKCSNRFNRSIFELFTFYFSQSKIRNFVSGNKEEFVQKFIKMNDDTEFIASVSDTTKEVGKVVVRFALFAELLSSLDGFGNSGISLKTLEWVNNNMRVENYTI